MIKEQVEDLCADLCWIGAADVVGCDEEGALIFSLNALGRSAAQLLMDSNFKVGNYDD